MEDERRRIGGDQGQAAKRAHGQKVGKAIEVQTQAQEIPRKATAGPRTCGEMEGSVISRGT